MNQTIIEGQLADLHQRRIYKARITIEGQQIASIDELPDHAAVPAHYIMPGFADAHVHVESSMLSPARFAAMALRHGTLATVSDPHEIGNVLGVQGVKLMADNAANLPFCLWLGAPSCVPATRFETAGAEITAEDIDQLFADGTCRYLAEVMNWPGVLGKDPELMAKLEVARQHGLPIDGHAPGLMGQQAADYAAAGIQTDHECYMLEEAQGKLDLGMWVLIREGSAARNFEALHPLLATHASRLMFCTDDAHPDFLQLGHVNRLAARALALGYDLFDVLQVACLNPVQHYGLPLGTLKPGDRADFIIVEDLTNFKVLEAWYKGKAAFANGQTTFGAELMPEINIMEAQPLQASQLKVAAGEGPARVIVAHEGQLITSEELVDLPVKEGQLQPDPAQDVMKLVVLNRYEKNVPPAVAFIKGLGVKEGALAATVAHDCHNIIAAGTDDESLARVINTLIDAGGGLALAQGMKTEVLPLPIAGLMCNQDGDEVAALYQHLNSSLCQMGCQLQAPFMTLSFMALLVIPDLKLSDRGLFSSQRWSFVPLEETA